MLPGAEKSQLRYIDLMGGQKPHLLVKTVNNLGAETEVHYAPSTKFYLKDKFAGRPWITKLSFPVHVVEKTTMRDKWRQTEFSSTYSYHHGYFDGVERVSRVRQKLNRLTLNRLDRLLQVMPIVLTSQTTKRFTSRRQSRSRGFTPAPRLIANAS